MEFTKEEQAVWSTGIEGVKDALRKKAIMTAVELYLLCTCYRAGTSQEQTYSEDQGQRQGQEGRHHQSHNQGQTPSPWD